MCCSVVGLVPPNCLQHRLFTVPYLSLRSLRFCALRYGRSCILAGDESVHMKSRWPPAILTILGTLKEQYPVTAHAPNFDFWTGCREIKRCEESKRILKNQFASRLAGFNTTLKLLRIIDQWYIVPVKFRFRQNLDFLALLLLPLAGGPKDWSHFDADLRAYFFC